MAMRETDDSPRLTPLGDRISFTGRLLRRPEDLSDEQFDLLAAAWAEDALDDKALDELDQIFISSPARRERAESFRNLRLSPGNDRWNGSKRALRHSTVNQTLRRSIIPVLAAAAVLIAFILAGPAAIRNTAGRLPVPGHEVAVMTEATIPAASPVTIEHRMTLSDVIAEPALNIRIADQQPVITVTETPRAFPIDIEQRVAGMRLIAELPARELAGIRLNNSIRSREVQEDETSWIARGIFFLANAITKDEKKVNGYSVASACVNGLNTVLGWDMELRQVSDAAGEPVSVNFNSSLLSFSTPVNKTSR
jgi:hypothetical protein